VEVAAVLTLLVPTVVQVVTAEMAFRRQLRDQR
jgi:hypothetical protein